MENYPSNSRSSRQPKKTEGPKKIERVTQGDVVQRKKPLGKKFKETFIQGDAKGVAGHILTSVLIPALKDMIWDAGSEGLRRGLWGENAPSRNRGGGILNQAIGHVAYNRYSSGPLGQPRRQELPTMSRRGRSTHDFGEIILATRVEANTVIERLYDLVNQFEVASVKDLYELVGAESDYTDEKWGWTSMQGSDVQRINEGYLLDLPRPEPID